MDEVGDDEEVAGEPRLGDDAELIGEAAAVVFRRGLTARGVRDMSDLFFLAGFSFLPAPLAHLPFSLPPFFAPAGEALGQPLFGEALQAVVFALAARREVGQARLGGARVEGAAAGDCEGVGQGLGQVGEEGGHLARGEEAEGGGAPGPVLVVEAPSGGDGEQRLVGLVEGGIAEEDAVGGDQRHALGARELAQQRLQLVFFRQAVAVELHVEAVAESGEEGLQELLCRFFRALNEGAGERPFGPAGQADEARRRAP